MTSLISAEWYKLLRGKVLAIILSGVAVLTLLKVLGELTSKEPILGQFGVMLSADLSTFWQMWLAVFVGYFVASEFQNGTMRNILALGKNRTHVYLSKLLSSCIAVTAIYITVTFVATAGLSSLVGFGGMTLSEFLRFFSWNFFMQILYHFTFAAIFTMFAFFCRSLGMTIILGFGYAIVMLFLPGVFNMLGLASGIKYLPIYYITFF